MDLAGSTTIRPWRSIWTEPRRTVRHLVDTDPDNSVMLLAGLNGLATALIQAITRGAGARFPLGTILTAAAVAGPLMGIVALQFYSVLLGWTGRLFGGAAPFRQIRTTVAWAEAPIVATLGLLIPATLVFRRALFALGAAAPVVALPLLLVTGVSGAWGLVIGTQGLAEVQRFSGGTALLNLLLAAVLFVIAFTCLGILTIWLFR